MSRTATPSLAGYVSHWKRLHHVETHFAKNYTLPDPWSAFFPRPAADPERRPFHVLAEQFSFAACERRGLVAHGRNPTEACAALAAAAGLPWEPEAVLVLEA